MSLENVVNALKRLSKNDRSLGQSSLPEEEEGLEYFCAEDTLLPNDLSVSVKGVGRLLFPLETDTVANIVAVSSKTTLAKGETTCDKTACHARIIPASMLKVKIDDKSICNILERISSGLNIDKSSCLVPHLYNMSIYTPGDYFKMHRASEKIKNMVAILVILLPFPHKGGDLIICHKNRKHIFFGSQKNDVVKCIAFYSDCQWEIEKVLEGSRVALTYYVALQSPSVINNVFLDEGLNRAVQLYFSSENTPKRLVFYLNHSYSEHSLKWHLLKEVDRVNVFSLIAVAKEQNRIPCLARAVYREECGMLNNYIVHSDTELVFWVDEYNLKFDEYTKVSDEELCYTMKTIDLFSPYRVKERQATRYYDNEGSQECWYRRACVVLWSDKWVFQHGFKNALYDLVQLITEKGNEKLALTEIKKAGSKFFNITFWNDPVIINLLMAIAAFINNGEIATAILIRLSNKVLHPDRIDYLLTLEQNCSKEVLVNIIQSWYKNQQYSYFVEKSLAIIEKYLEHTDKKHNSQFVEILLNRTVKEFLRKHKARWDLCIFKATQLNTIYKIFEICTELMEYHNLIKNVFDFIFLHPSVYPLHLPNVLLHLQNMIPDNDIHKHRNFIALTSEHCCKLTSQLTKDETDWSWPFNLICKCPYCCQLKFCLNSSEKTINVALSSVNQRHVKGVLEYLSEQPVRFMTRGTDVFIEKKPVLQETRKKILDDLIFIEDKQKKWTLTQQVSVHSESTNGNNNASSFNGSSENELDSGEPRNKIVKMK